LHTPPDRVLGPMAPVGMRTRRFAAAQARPNGPGVASVCRGCLLAPWSSSPSPGLLSAAWPRPVLSQAPPPNPTAAESDGRRVLSWDGAADHEVTPQAPLTGSGCR